MKRELDYIACRLLSCVYINLRLINFEQFLQNPLNCNGIDAEIGGTSAHLGMM